MAVSWPPCGGARPPPADARATIAEAYEFLVDCWERGDRIYLFGVGRGAYCANAMARLLGTVGVLPDLMDYVLAAYAVPRTRRSPQDWRRRHSAGRPTGRTSRNRCSRTVFGTLGHGRMCRVGTGRANR